MKTYEELFELIMKTAKEDERIRAVTMEGSGVATSAKKDRYSDFDITFFVKDVREFSNDKHYMERFGEILILQCPEDWYEHPYDYEGRDKFVFLTQFKDGNRIDLSVVDISKIAEQVNFDEPRTVLLNKDQFKELVNITSESVFYITRPGAMEYFHTCNEFRWLSNYVTKGLCRRELYYAKHIMDNLMMNMFMKILQWKIGIEHNFEVSIGAHGKHLKKYLSEKEMERFAGIFANGTYEDMWEKLFLFYDYFAELAEYVANQLEFTYDAKETQEVRDFMVQRLQESRE